jgi:hypothetical protein
LIFKRCPMGPVARELVSRLGVVHRAPARTADPAVPALVSESRKTRPMKCPVSGGQTVQ